MTGAVIQFTFRKPGPGRIEVVVTRQSDGRQLYRNERLLSGKTPSDLASAFKADVLAWTYHAWSVSADWPCEISTSAIWAAFRDAIAAYPRDGRGMVAA